MIYKNVTAAKVREIEDRAFRFGLAYGFALGLVIVGFMVWIFA